MSQDNIISMCSKIYGFAQYKYVTQPHNYTNYFFFSLLSHLTFRVTTCKLIIYIS